MSALRSLVLAAAAAAILTACQTAAPPLPSVPAPREPGPAPRPPATTGKTIPAEEAAQLCILKASKKFNVGIGDVKVLETRKVDAGWRTALSVGGVNKACVLTPGGDLRSLI